jgi:hypothetical protein
MHYMWADTLQAVERAHLLRVLVWGAANILAGTALLAWIRAGTRQSALLRHFAYQCAGWGCAEVALAAVQLGQLAPRDLSSATRFDRVLWLNIGLDGGYVLTGVVLAIAGWRLARALGGVGAGIGIVMQGFALAVLDLLLAAQISR